MTGRFLQVDPVFGGGCNGYDYTCQDPVNSSDLGGTIINTPGGGLPGYGRWSVHHHNWSSASLDDAIADFMGGTGPAHTNVTISAGRGAGKVVFYNNLTETEVAYDFGGDYFTISNGKLNLTYNSAGDPVWLEIDQMTEAEKGLMHFENTGSVFASANEAEYVYRTVWNMEEDYDPMEFGGWGTDEFEE